MCPWQASGAGTVAKQLDIRKFVLFFVLLFFPKFCILYPVSCITGKSEERSVMPESLPGSERTAAEENDDAESVPPQAGESVRADSYEKGAGYLWQTILTMRTASLFWRVWKQ